MRNDIKNRGCFMQCTTSAHPPGTLQVRLQLHGWDARQTRIQCRSVNSSVVAVNDLGRDWGVSMKLWGTCVLYTMAGSWSEVKLTELHLWASGCLVSLCCLHRAVCVWYFQSDECKSTATERSTDGTSHVKCTYARGLSSKFQISSPNNTLTLPNDIMRFICGSS